MDFAQWCWIAGVIAAGLFNVAVHVYASRGSWWVWRP